MTLCTCVRAFDTRVSRPLQQISTEQEIDTDTAAAVNLPMLPPLLKPIHIALNALIIIEPFGGWIT